MANISSETLFHFTPKPEYLFQILESEFKPRYYVEIIQLKGMIPMKKAIPMVCFCDIPLSQIKNHIETYGNYGLGMSKKWAIKNNLNPVLYLEPSSKLSKSIIKIAKIHKEHKISGTDGIRNLFRYIKHYQGDFMRAGKIIEDVVFYNEREWRYVPDPIAKTKLWLEEEDFNNPTVLADNNDQIGQTPLSFKPSDIKYIIIKNENEISPMINALKRIKGKYPQEVIENLVSRIITTEQIMKDF